MSVSQKLLDAVKQLELSVRDGEKFDGGNASAGSRLRKECQVVVRALRDVRKTVQEVKAVRKAEAKAAKDAAKSAT